MSRKLRMRNKGIKINCILVCVLQLHIYCMSSLLSTNNFHNTKSYYNFWMQIMLHPISARKVALILAASSSRSRQSKQPSLCHTFREHSFTQMRPATGSEEDSSIRNRCQSIDMLCRQLATVQLEKQKPASATLCSTLGARGFLREGTRSAISEARSGEERENRQEGEKTSG